MFLHVAGLVIIIRAPGQDPVVRLRGVRMMALGFGLVVLGPALVFVIEGVVRGDPMLIIGPFVAFGPFVFLMFWFRHRVRVPE